MKIRHAAILILALCGAVPALSQNKIASEDLLKAVREGDGNKLTELARDNGVSFLNTRGYDGSTALTLAVKAKNLPFTDYLLSRGADPDWPGIGNEPPLVIAARQGWEDGVAHLLVVGARADATNRQGETALIVAVQQRDRSIVRRLLAAGANPDRTDSAAGFSARDYAKRDNRARDLLTMIEQARPTPRKP